jgi:hypothetical protein
MAKKGFESRQKREPWQGTMRCFMGIGMELPDTSSASELRFKAALEAATGVTFEKARPSWLSNPMTGQGLEA